MDFIFRSIFFAITYWLVRRRHVFNERKVAFSYSRTYYCLSYLQGRNNFYAYFICFCAMPVLIIGGALVFIGMLAIYSVSIHESFTLTLSLIAQQKMTGEPSNYFYFFRQLRNI